MLLPTDACEYATVTFTSYPTGATAEASVDRQSWFPFDVPVTAQTDGTWMGRVLLRGPTSTSTAGTVVTDGTQLWARIHNAPEVVPVQAGTVYIV